MTTPPADDRLLHLERAQRRLTGVTLILGVLLVLTLAWQLLPFHPVIVARSFLVRGRGGVARAELSEWPDRSVVLRLNNASGKARGMWRMFPDGGMTLYVADSAGNRRAELGLAADGEPRLVLAGPRGEWRAVVAPADSGRAGIVLFDSQGRSLVRLP